MPNVSKTKSQDIIRFNQVKNEPIKQDHLQVETGVVRKIVLKKKNKKSLNGINDHIIQTQSQLLIDTGQQKDSKFVQESKNREENKKQMPFISFMASSSEQLEQLQTPYLHPSPTPSYNLWSKKKNVEAFPMLQDDDKEQRVISRTMSKPIEKTPLQTPLKKAKGSLQRNVSLKSQLPINHKNNIQKPADVFWEKDDRTSSFYERSREGSRPNLVLKSNKEDKISVLQDQFSQKMENTRLKQTKNSQSANLLLRGDNDGVQNVNTESKIGRKNIKIGINPAQNQLKQAIQSSEGESQSQNLQQLTSRTEVILQPFLSKQNGYSSYIELQSRQLQEQKQRMHFYADETNKLLCNVENYQLPIKDQTIIDKQYHPLKYMMEELVELFCMKEVIKYQLRYRSYEMITKIYAQASKYYQQKIPFEDPIKVYTFSLALKALLPTYEKNELEVVISRIFNSQHLMSFEDFSKCFQPIIDSKLVSILQPDSMKKELDKTIEKTKRLFVLIIEIEYFTKKIKEILRANTVVYDSIILQCTSFDNPLKFDMQLLEKYFLEGEMKNSLKKLKLALFFRNTIGNDLLKSNWSDWVYKQEMRLYNRYEGKFVFERLHSENIADRKQTYIKASLNRKKNEGGSTSILYTSRNENQSRKEF